MPRANGGAAPRSGRVGEWRRSPAQRTVVQSCEARSNHEVLTDDLGLRTVPIPFVQITNLAATIEALSQKHIPHITVLTNPRIHGDFQTSLPIGDIVLAEPKCGDIGTHNPTMGKPENTRQHQLQQPVEDNLIDMYVNRKDLKKTLIQILSFFAG